MTLREIWNGKIFGADYDAHMAANGQAEANAGLIRELFVVSPPQAGAEILFAGAGTGQMFDYLPAVVLAPYRTTFSDLNPKWLEVLTSRLEGSGLPFETAVDDVEHTRFGRRFELVIAVLVLEHVDWRRAVRNLCKIATSRVAVIVQENPPNLVESQTPVGTMSLLWTTRPYAIDRADLASAFEREGFRLFSETARGVDDGKQMIALEFRMSRPPTLFPPL